MIVTVVQPAIPSYRVPFFARLSDRLGAQFQVYHSEPDMGVLTRSLDGLDWAVRLGPEIRLPMGLSWQRGALRLPIPKNSVLVLCASPRCISNLLLLARGRLLGVRVVWWGHLWSASSSRSGAWLRRIVMRFASALLFYTEAEARSFRDQYFRRAPAAVGALNNGLDLTWIRKSRERFDPFNRGRRVFFIGRLTAKAELCLMIRALASPACLDVQLDVVGDGPQKVCLKLLADSLNVSARICWHEATVDERRIAKIANRCSLFVYPGGVGLSLIHAMAYGLPAIIHDEPLRHMPEHAAFTENVTGKYFHRGNVDDLSYSIASVLADPHALGEMSRASIEVTERSFNVDDMVERFLRVTCE